MNLYKFDLKSLKMSFRKSIIILYFGTEGVYIYIYKHIRKRFLRSTFDNLSNLRSLQVQIQSNFNLHLTIQPYGTDAKSMQKYENM